MRILDKYTTKSVIFAYLSCLFIFLFLYIMVDLFSHLDEMLKEHVGLSVLISYYLSFIPLMFVQVSPIACLLGLLYTMGDLSRHNEIIAMRASGVSVWRITQPIIVFGFLVSIIVFLANERFAPLAQSANYQIKTQVLEKNALPKNRLIYNLAVYGQNNRHFFIDIYHPDKQMMENVVILEHDENQNVVSKTVAKEAYFKNGTWLLRKCIISYFDQKGRPLGQPFYFENKFMRLKDKPADFISQRQKTMFMNAAQLKNYINRLSTSGASAVLRKLKVDLYNRFTFPFTSFIIILVGIPFALGPKKKGQAIASLGICIGISFFYYVLNQTSIALGQQGILPPFISAILSHGIFLGFSIAAIRKLP